MPDLRGWGGCIGFAGAGGAIMDLVCSRVNGGEGKITTRYLITPVDWSLEDFQARFPRLRANQEGALVRENYIYIYK